MTRSGAPRLSGEALEQLARILAADSSYDGGKAPERTASAAELEALFRAVEQLPFYVYSLSGPLEGPLRARAFFGHPEAVLGRSRDELVGIDAGELPHPDEVAHHYGVAERAIAKGDYYDVMGRAAPVDDEDRWFVSLGKAAATEDGQLEFFGITAKSREVAALQAELRDQARRLEALTANIPGAVYEYRMDAEGRFSVPYISEGIGSVLGVSPEDVMADPDSMGRYVLAEEIPGLLESVHHSATTLEPWIRAYRVRLASGEVKTLFGAGRPQRLEDGATVWNSLVIDITQVERRNAEERRRQREALEAQKHESLGRLASGVAHDLNNFMVGVLANASLLTDAPGDEVAEIAAEIETAAKRCAELTGQILAFSGHGQLEGEAVNLNELVQEMARLVERPHRAHLTLHVQVPEESVWVHGDPTQLRQVVLNLLTNAAQSSDSAVEARVSLSIHGERARLAVADDGRGVPEEQQDRIFEPFFTTKADGRGLGLSASAGIVRAHGGEISVRSSESAGARFVVLLPLSSAPGCASSPPSRPVFTAGGRALVVDDEAQVRLTTSRLLSRRGFSVTEVDSGMAALARFREEHFDYVVLDLTMPKMTGEAVLQEMRRIRPEQRVVLCSGYADTQVEALLDGTSNVTFLRKPFTARDLLAALERLTETDLKG